VSHAVPESRSMPENAYIPRLKAEFEKVIVPELTKQFG
jgi:hypothetical protein